LNSLANPSASATCRRDRNPSYPEGGLMGARTRVDVVLTDENANFDVRSEQLFIRVFISLDRRSLRPAENLMVGNQHGGELRARLGW